MKLTQQNRDYKSLLAARKILARGKNPYRRAGLALRPVAELIPEEGFGQGAGCFWLRASASHADEEKTRAHESLRAIEPCRTSSRAPPGTTSECAPRSSASQFGHTRSSTSRPCTPTGSRRCGSGGSSVELENKDAHEENHTLPHHKQLRAPSSPPYSNITFLTPA